MDEILLITGLVCFCICNFCIHVISSNKYDDIDVLMGTFYLVLSFLGLVGSAIVLYFS